MYIYRGLLSSTIGMGSLSLVEMYDELRIAEMITRREIKSDEVFTMNILDSLEKKSRMNEDLTIH